MPSSVWNCVWEKALFVQWLSFLNLFSRPGFVSVAFAPAVPRCTGAGWVRRLTDSAPPNSERLLDARNAALGCSPFASAVQDHRGRGLEPRSLRTRRRWWWAASLHLPPRAGERWGICAVVAQPRPGLRPSAQRGLCRCRERRLRLRRRPGGGSSGTGSAPNAAESGAAQMPR